MIEKYELCKDHPGIRSFTGLQGTVTMYPIRVRINGNWVILHKMIMDELSTLDINVNLDIEALKGTDSWEVINIPRLSIVNSQISGPITLRRGEILASRIEATAGDIDTVGSIINSKLVGHITIGNYANVVSSRLLSGMLVMSADTVMENTEVEGPLLLMDEASVFGCEIRVRYLSSISSHATLCKCRFVDVPKESFKINSNCVIYNNETVYGFRTIEEAVENGKM